MTTIRVRLIALALTMLACHGLSAGETKPTGTVRATVPPEASNTGEARPGECTPAPGAEPAAESAKNTGPGRISTNMTVPKQTQRTAPVGASPPAGSVSSAPCAQMPEPEPMTTPEATDK